MAANLTWWMQRAFIRRQPHRRPKSQPIRATASWKKGMHELPYIDRGRRPAPSFMGIYRRTEKMTDGSVITVDEAYLRESIADPEAKIVDGYDDVMPEPVLTEKEIDEMVEYLKTLK